MNTAKGQREPGDDFYCFKYQVWYRLDDCCFRHFYRTTPGCADCAQGEMNLLRLASVPRRPRYTELPRPVAASR